MKVWMMSRVSLVPALVVSAMMMSTNVGAADQLDRTVLPIQLPKRPLYNELDVRKAKAPPHFEVTAPAGAPNVLVVLVDDLGFAGTSTFGGPVDTPILATSMKKTISTMTTSISGVTFTPASFISGIECFDMSALAFSLSP